MLIALSLLGCDTYGTAATPPPPPPPPPIAEVEREAPMPAGQLIVRQCFGSSADGISTQTGSAGLGSRGTGTGGGGYSSPAKAPTSSRATATTSSPAPAAPATAAEPAPAPTSTPSGAAGPSTGGVFGGTASQRSRDEGAKVAANRADDGLADAEASGRASSSSAEKKGDARPPPPADAPAGERAKQKDEDRAQPALAREESRAASEPNLDWGATVYLSNDDSMSLASAQRLLWAVQQKGAVQASQVRPHEFLNYFSFDTATVQPGQTFSVLSSAAETSPGTLTVAFAVKGAMPKRQPLDLTLVLDRSGSMSAEGRMAYLKRGLTKMTESLQRGDRVDFVLFDDEVCSPLENYVVGRDDPSVLASVIEQLQPRGSTDLDAGLREGYRIAGTHADVAGRNRRMLLISDALLNTGNVDPNLVSEVGKAYEEADIRLTAVGVGRDFNDKVLDMLSEKGKGAYVYLGSEAVVDRVFGVGFASLTQTIAHDVHFALDLPPSLAMERFYGEEMSTNRDEVQPIHYFAGTTQLFLQDLRVRGRPVPSDPVVLTIEYQDPITDQARTQVMRTTVGALLDADTRNLDKGRALIAWTDLILARAMGGDPCGSPFSTWQSRVSQLGEDAEIGWLDGLTSPLCGARPVAPVARAGVPYKVRVDSDTPIAEVALACQGWQDREALSGSDTIASFTPQAGSSCVLTLSGAVPMATNVTVPSTGADLRCLVRGGRMSCS